MQRVSNKSQIVYHIYQNALQFINIQVPSRFVTVSIHKMPPKCWKYLRD